MTMPHLGISASRLDLVYLDPHTLPGNQASQSVRVTRTDQDLRVGSHSGRPAPARGVAQPGRETQDMEAFLEKTLPELGLERSLFEVKYTIAKDVLPALLEEAENHELVVLGATREGLFQQMVMGTLPEEFARQCNKPLVMVKAAHRVKSFIRRWI